MLEELPTELLLQVISFCATSACSSLTRVSRRFNALSTPELFRRTSDPGDPSVVGQVVRGYKHEADILKFLQNTQRYGPDYSKREAYTTEPTGLLLVNPLYVAVYRGFKEVSTFLIDTARIPYQHPIDVFDHSLVEVAVREGHGDILRILLDRGAPFAFDNRNALVQAARANKQDIVSLLVQTLRYNINELDGDGNTALCGACNYSLTPSLNRKMAMHLIKLGAETDVEAIIESRRPLARSIATGGFRIASMLMNHGAMITGAVIANVRQVIDQDVGELHHQDQEQLPDLQLKHCVSFLRALARKLDGTEFGDVSLAIDLFLFRLKNAKG